MTRRTAAVAVLLACAAVSACGKKGALLPPIVLTPMKPEAVKVSQRGATLFVEWKNPDKSIDGTLLSGVGEAEVWIAEEDRATAGRGRLTPKEFEAKAVLAASLKKDGLAGPYAYSLSGKKPASLKLHIAVRVRDDRSRTSGFSDPVAFEPRLSPGPPSELSARVLEDRIELSWKAPAANIDGSTPAAVKAYNIYTRGADGKDKAVNASPVAETKYADPTVVFDVPVSYRVRASATDKPPYFESDDSEALEAVPKDVFPPAAPARVVAVTGHGSVSLSWEANGEKDLAGYRVRRREDAGGEEVLLTPALLIENAYTDATIEKGKRYRYSMSAVDIRGNESARTETVVTAPEEGPA